MTTDIAKLLIDDNAIRKLIVPKPWKHKWHEGRCVCGADVNFDDVILPEGGCPIPDKIDLDWNLAMKMRDEIGRAYDWAEAKVEVYAVMFPQMELHKKERFRRIGIAGAFFGSLSAQPKHYLIAAIIAEEGE